MSALQPKPLASLSSALLARKGHAKPAMRPQGFVQLGQPTSIVDDLGWNDMGDPEPETVAAPPVPTVLIQREALREEIEQDEPTIETAEPAVALAPAPARRDVALPACFGRKAAFTLRLDADRHLRLRLASASRGRSAQMLVTQALDAFLATLPEVEALAMSLPSPGANQDMGN